MIHFRQLPLRFLTLPLLTSLSLFCTLPSCIAQPKNGPRTFTRQDTLRGSITPERAWWDVEHYAISVTPDITNKTISGANTLQFRVTAPGRTMQIDLQEPMQLLAAEYKGQSLPLKRDGNIYLLQFPQELSTGSRHSLLLRYSGKPREAVNPPWDGGWIWRTDKQGSPWMSVACQHLGASVWYPCKDHQSDEPDSGATLSITVPDTLVAVGNGRLSQQVTNGNGTTTWTWTVRNPINNYNIIPYIGKYVHWGEVYPGEKGPLDCNYWVLDYNLEKARHQFTQATSMLRCFEEWFGPYPFYEDGYKLVESPHLGMEHQSAVAYGNRFEDGYLGRDLSGSGWGKKWDFIIVHESGHEWFANNITTRDIADMWVHEGFTNYSETIYTTCLFGTEAGNDYCIGNRKNVQNDKPIIGPYGVNEEGSGDMYDKAGNMIHTIRQLIDNDSSFKQLLRGLNRDFYHQTVTGKQVEAYIIKATGLDLQKVFDQYLRTVQIPTLEYRSSKGSIEFRWTSCVEGFNMPVKVTLGEGHTQWLKPSTNWTSLKLADWHNGKTFTANRNFYIQTKKVS
ncbi:MAG: M1 family metallopeptidase [Candidatus Pseudobacter hemicellulosilyticus]|uniref:M1 family metallopeptidase n=1 Tax=Candidatus Pseudobacter hemicellulosilyticus TaxID=3121375 RepID=A0AAJ6BHE2_9BACT|nr:MAG: M1 family metallopeptidase [Pseudobacter sp.]